MRSMLTPISEAVSLILEGRAHRAAELGPVDQEIGADDQRRAHRRARTAGSQDTETGPSTSGASGNGVVDRFRDAAPKSSSSPYCIAIQAPIITSMVVSMSEPRSGRSRSTRSPRPSSHAEHDGERQRQEEIHSELMHHDEHDVGAEACTARRA